MRLKGDNKWSLWNTSIYFIPFYYENTQKILGKPADKFFCLYKDDARRQNAFHPGRYIIEKIGDIE